MTYHLFSTPALPRHGRVLSKDGATVGVNSIELGAVMPDFVATTTKGKISYNEWAGNSWVYLFSHPAAFTPICTTEIASVARHSAEFAERNVKCLALTGDTVTDLQAWADEIDALFGASVDFPHIADTHGQLAKALGMRSDEAAGEYCNRRSILIGPDKRIRLISDYPMNIGRSTAEVLRTIDALQMAEKLDVYIPEGWSAGGPMFLSHLTSPEDLTRRYGRNWEKVNDYMRYFPAMTGSRQHKAICASDMGSCEARPTAQGSPKDSAKPVHTDATRILKLFSSHRQRTE